MASYALGVVPPAPVANGTLVSEDVLRKHPELFFQGSDIVWMLMASALVFLMVPAISLFYSGLGDRFSTITLLRMPIITAAFCTTQWYLWGYAMTFSSGPSDWYGGDSRAPAFNDVYAQPVGSGTDGFKIPELVYAFYQGMFASFTAALVCGGVIKKMQIGRFIVFISLWSILVYYPVARWTWSPQGWSNRSGVLDFAGGTAVHITSGTTVLAVIIFQMLGKYKLGIFKRLISFFLEEEPETSPKKPSGPELGQETVQPGPSTLMSPAVFGDKDSGIAGSIDANQSSFSSSELAQPGVASPARQPGALPSEREESQAMSRAVTTENVDVEAGLHTKLLTKDAPHSINSVVLGTSLLWIGWFGFNGGAALGGNLRAVSACVSTHLSASSGACTMLLLIWIQNWRARRRRTRKGKAPKAPLLSITPFCDGAVVGLVAITPAAGYVPPWSAVIFGCVAATLVYVLQRLTTNIMIRHDPLFVFIIHTGGGMVGMFFTGVFARDYVVGLDGYSVLPHHDVGEQLRWQVIDAIAGFGYTLVMTIIALFIVKLIQFPFTRNWTLLEYKPDKLEAELEYRRQENKVQKSA